VCPPEHSYLKSKAATQSRQIPPRSTKFLETVSRNPSTHAAPLTVTHPSIPSQEGKYPHATNLSLPKRTQLPNLPVPERGRGCVTPVHSLPKQSIHPKPRNATSLKREQENHCGNFRGNLTSCPPYSRNATSRMRSGRSPSVANRSAARTDCGVTPKRAAILPVSPRLITILFIF